MVKKEKLVEITESAIDNLIMAFKATPYFFTQKAICTVIYTVRFSTSYLLKIGNARRKMESRAFFCIKNIQPKKDIVQKPSKKKFQKVHVVTLICQFGTLRKPKKDCFGPLDPKILRMRSTRLLQ